MCNHLIENEMFKIDCMSLMNSLVIVFYYYSDFKKRIIMSLTFVPIVTYLSIKQLLGNSSGLKGYILLPISLLVIYQYQKKETA